MPKKESSNCDKTAQRGRGGGAASNSSGCRHRPGSGYFSDSESSDSESSSDDSPDRKRARSRSVAAKRNGSKNPSKDRKCDDKRRKKQSQFAKSRPRDELGRFLPLQNKQLTAMNNGEGGGPGPGGSGGKSGGVGKSGSAKTITKTFSDEEEMQPTSTSSIERFDFFGEEGSLRDQDAGDPTNRDVI